MLTNTSQLIYLDTVKIAVHFSEFCQRSLKPCTERHNSTRRQAVTAHRVL